ncbi:MAG: hypothetical protein JSW51_08045 [Gemmatimonadota bacterium]|nr:MAG: hypothetical protein JSW51_08045 [Gemmatimonadota bacterium]
MRPTFSVELPLSADEAIERIRAEIASSQLNTMSAGRCAEFRVAESERRFWSPYLSVQVQDTPEGSLLRGRFSPRPEIWTMFMFVYFVMTFAIFFGAAFGYVQWAMGDSPWGLLAVPGGILVIVLLHAASLVGQRLSSDQTVELREALDLVLQKIRD